MPASDSLFSAHLPAIDVIKLKALRSVMMETYGLSPWRRLYCKRPEGEASQEEKLCSWTGSPAPSSQWLPESTENQATCRATWSAQKALLVFYEINWKKFNLVDISSTWRVWRYTFFLLRSLKKGLMSSLFTPRVAEGGYKITNWYRQWKCAHRRLCKAIPHSERHWQGETWGYNSHHWSRTVFQILGGQGSKKPTPEVVAIRLSKVCPAEQTISNLA